MRVEDGHRGAEAIGEGPAGDDTASGVELPIVHHAHDLNGLVAGGGRLGDETQAVGVHQPAVAGMWLGTRLVRRAREAGGVDHHHHAGVGRIARADEWQQFPSGTGRVLAVERLRAQDVVTVLVEERAPVGGGTAYGRVRGALIKEEQPAVLAHQAGAVHGLVHAGGLGDRFCLHQPVRCQLGHHLAVRAGALDEGSLVQPVLGARELEELLEVGTDVRAVDLTPHAAYLLGGAGQVHTALVVGHAGTFLLGARLRER